jgi:hypothetical protein
VTPALKLMPILFLAEVGRYTVVAKGNRVLDGQKWKAIDDVPRALRGNVIDYSPVPGCPSQRNAAHLSAEIDAIQHQQSND